MFGWTLTTDASNFSAVAIPGVLFCGCDGFPITEYQLGKGFSVLLGTIEYCRHFFPFFLSSRFQRTDYNLHFSQGSFTFHLEIFRLLHLVTSPGKKDVKNPEAQDNQASRFIIPRSHLLDYV